MKFVRLLFLCAAALTLAGLGYATIFGNVRGIVHDPQHRPVHNAKVTLHASQSAWAQTVYTNPNGEFEFSAVPAGDYSLTVNAQGFQPAEQSITVSSGSAPILHFPLEIATTKQSIRVAAAPETINTQSSSTETLVDKQMIARTPGADRANSMAMITDYVPGAYMVHDLLHVRGGHQVTWDVDGVPVPNTNIASNVGPQFNPMDADYVEMATGGYSAEYGDRTYGVFNVIPHTGFEYNNSGELVLNYGSYNQTNDQLSFGNHTDRLAWYGSFSANRSDLGLMTPVPQVIHDMDSGLGGFGTLIFNATPNDQLRMVASTRSDHYQIPNTPDDQDAGIRDLDLERDSFVNFSWVHTFSPGMLLTVSPFFHNNRANYLGGPDDTPFILNDNRSSNYAGGQVTFSAVVGKQNAEIGIETFGQFDSTFFGLRSNPVTQPALQQSFNPSGNLEALFFQDQYRPTSWLSLNGGLRFTRYSGLLNETSASPRLGAAIIIPRLRWVLHGYYSQYYQPPPLDTVSGPLLNFVIDQGFGFVPLPGERDHQWDAGITIPVRDWSLNFDHFRTSAANFLDHDEIGNSDIFLPLTDLAALINGNEVIVRSPQIFGRAHLSIAYSNQVAKGLGPITGGLIEDTDTGYFYLDHDQRNTLSAVLTSTLPYRTWATSTIEYGSGFLNGDGPDHLPAHTTVGLSLGKSFGETWSLAVNALNIGNERYLLDNSNTFGGTHYVNPREVYVEMRYRFHF
jgi:Carboxypeptidase regulatory-like domain/TonB dependent receptor-like, beta-barrel